MTYTFKDDSYKNFNYSYFDQIQALNSQGKVINQLQFSLTKGADHARTYSVLQDGKQLAQLEYRRVKYKSWSDGLDDFPSRWEKSTHWILTKAKREQSPEESYIYASILIHHPGHQKMVRKDLPEGRCLEIGYFSEGGNRVWPNSITHAQGDVVGRVMQLRAPAGSDETPIPIYRFLYDLSSLRTEVYDAYDRCKIYHYSSRERLTKIEHFAGTPPRVSYAEERFVWGEPGTPDCGNLMSKVFASKGSNLFCRNYVYDDRGNVLHEHLYGNLTGKEQPAVALDPQGKGIENGCDHLYIGRLYTNDDRNLVRYENCPDKPHNFKYSYIEGTDLLEARYTMDVGNIRMREFFSYDENGAVTLEISDDGTTLDRDNLTGVTERKIRRIKNTSTFPVGLPCEVREKCLNLATGKERLLKGLVNTFDDQGHLIRQTHYDSQWQELYTLTWVYDAMGHVLEETNALGHKISRSYDGNGNTIREQGPLPEMIRTYAYDYMNRLIREEKGSQRLTTTPRLRSTWQSNVDNRYSR